MNSDTFASLLANAATAPLPIEVTREGRNIAADIAARCPRCNDDLAYCCCTAPMGDPDSYPSDEEYAQMQAEAEDALLQGLEAIQAEPDHYPTLAERLANSMRDDR